MNTSEKQRVVSYDSFMERTLGVELDGWLCSASRRALVLRGARQVGKTWLVRDLAARAGLELIEVNFERNPGLARVFADHDPHRVLGDLALALEMEIDPGRSLLFLDEIQAAPAVLGSLRWFTEELSQLPVIAAGSLLEFALNDHQYSVPVGRLSYLNLEPMSFPEYLLAHGQRALVGRLQDWHPPSPIGEITHEKAMGWYDRYAMVGGMPAAVAEDVEHGDPRRCRRLQADLMTAFRDDFAKYIKRLDPGILDSTLLSVVAQLGRKFVYARVGEGVKQHQAKRSLEMLARARLLTIAQHSSANGVPLGGEVRARNRKVLLLDIGLAHALLGTPAATGYPRFDFLASAIRGQLAEQLAGQQLRVLPPGSGYEPTLFYWQRDGGRPGEIDFLIQIDDFIVPVELKAGAAGAMKSLHQFTHDKGFEFAVRVDRNPPTVQDVEVKTTQGDPSRYRLLNLPGYLLWRVAELATECRRRPEC